MKDIWEEFKVALDDVEDGESLKQLKARFLGKKGRLTVLFKQLPSLPAELRRERGKDINELKARIEEALRQREEFLRRKKEFEALEREAVDISLPGRRMLAGGLHPITVAIKEMESIFRSFGFSVESGPEIELDLFNFEMLNIPKEHPARDMQDTYYIDEKRLLRTHTSPTQIRVMKHRKPPLMFIAPGRVYRRDSDITHSPMFHQIEGLLVDKNIRFSDLKGVLEGFLRVYFGDVAVRFRPSYFPFTEPSAEVDIGCIFCGGKGCRVCSRTGYLEVMGCGMVHPNVLHNVGYGDEWNGFAFGLGVERFAMLKYRIDNIRVLFENDVRFLDEFSMSRGKVL